MNERYEAFDPLQSAALVHHYITHMVDKAQDNLPYWLLLPNKKPAEAAHCRVDDAELVGSWYEGLHSAMQMLGTADPALREKFRAHKDELRAKVAKANERIHE